MACRFGARLGEGRGRAANECQIVDGLLALSRADDAAIPRQEIDLAALARARVEQWQALAEESRVHITVTAPPTAPAVAVPGAAEQIIDNLIDNALVVSPPDTTIELTIAAAAGIDAVDLHVLDEGPGMSAQDCARAFDRFWRGRTDIAGSGLGLAIVARLARASGATADLTPRFRTSGGSGLDAHVRFESARS